MQTELLKKKCRNTYDNKHPFLMGFVKGMSQSIKQNVNCPRSHVLFLLNQLDINTNTLGSILGY